MVSEVEAVAATLSTAGFISAEEEAGQIVEAALGDGDVLNAMVQRRLTGEPLAWITGWTSFCEIEIRVLAGVYVPRWQTEVLARRAVERLPVNGTAIDVCTGSGAIAKTLMTHRPRARVIACDIDATAVACAKANGVETYLGDLFASMPGGLDGQVDVVVGIVPYVPTQELPLLQRDTFTFETPLAYDGGVHGVNILRRVIADSGRFLRPQGTLLLELGGEQAELLAPDLERLGYKDVERISDEEGDLRGIEATFSARRRSWRW